MSDLHKAIGCCLAGIVAALVFCVVLSRRADEAGRRLSNLDVRLFVLEADARARQPANVYTFGELPNLGFYRMSTNINFDINHRWHKSDTSEVFWMTLDVGLKGDVLVWRPTTNCVTKP